MVKLTIGMPTYNDFDGVYFTLQALRLYQDLADTELLVVDNYGCEHTKKFVEGGAKGRYILATDAVGTAAAKNRVFAEARGEAVLCCDSHVLFDPGAIARLKAYYRSIPTAAISCKGLSWHDDLKTISTHYKPGVAERDVGHLGDGPAREWIRRGSRSRSGCRGWGSSVAARQRLAGLQSGLSRLRRRRRLHPREGPARREPAACACPGCAGCTASAGPAGVPYPALLFDKVRNYIIGFTEVGLDREPIRSHFSNRLSAEQFAAMEAEAVALVEGQSAGSIRPAATPPSPQAAGITPAGVAASAVPVEAPPALVMDPASTGRRAIVCFVEDKPHLVQQLLALYLSWLETNSPDTDLVVMGPEAVLARLPEELIKIPQQPAADDPVWRGYRYINPIAGLNGAGAEQLDAYSHLLRTDVDTFITPAWNAFYPATFTFGTSTYANADVPQRIQALAAEYGLTHRGLTNIHTTWYGPTAVVRRAAAFTELLTKHLLTHEFAQDPGKWPGWFRGVAVRYAGEIAVNHCAPDAQRSELLDAPSTSPESIERYPHIHCWHTDQRFSKHAFMRGRLHAARTSRRATSAIIHNYCLALSLLSLEELAPVP